MKKLIRFFVLVSAIYVFANTSLAFDETFERAKSLAVKYGTSQGGFFSKKNYVLIREIPPKAYSISYSPLYKGFESVDLTILDLNTKSAERVSAVWDAKLLKMDYEFLSFIREKGKMKILRTISLDEYEARQRAQGIMNIMLIR